MKTVIGIVLVLAGIVAGLYFGIWWAFIEHVRAAQINSLAIALSIARVFLAGLIGWVCSLVLILPGLALLRTDP